MPFIVENTSFQSSVALYGHLALRGYRRQNVLYTIWATFYKYETVSSNYRSCMLVRKMVSCLFLVSVLVGSNRTKWGKGTVRRGSEGDVMGFPDLTL